MIIGLIKRMEVNFLGQTLIFRDAYHVIDSFRGNNEVAEIEVVIYDNEEKLNILATRFYSFSMNEESSNVIQLGYDHMLKQAEYIDARVIREINQ